MDFKNKYLKYKIKYFKLLYQKGGNLPIDIYLKNINLFNFDSDIEKYLNPFYGYIWINYNVITNYYRFYVKNSDDNDIISILVHRTFYKIGENILPSQLLKNFNVVDYSNLIGNLYLIKNNLDYKKNISLLRMFNFYKNNEKTINILFVKLKSFLNYNKGEEQIDKLTKRIETYKINKDNNLLTTINNNINFLINKSNTEISKITQNIESNNIIKKKLFNIKLITHNLDNINIFHWLLTLLIYKLSDKEKIKEYYEELNKILPIEERVIIKDDYINDNYTFKELDIKTLESQAEIEKENKNNYNIYALIMLKKINKIPINLYTQKHTKTYLYNKEYPDCGETSVRNFINIITYDFDTNTFDLDKFNSLEPKDTLREYYRVFNNFKKQNNDDITFRIFGEELNARDAWDVVVSNLDNVKYDKSYIEDGKEYNYEIDSGTSKDGEENNMLCLLKILFPKIEEWKSFDNENIEIETNLTNNYGHIKITVDNDIYNWLFMDEHYDLVYKEKIKKINYVFFSDDDMMKFYEDMYNKNYEFLIKKYNETKNWYYYILNNDEDIIKFFNISADFLSDEEYCKIYEYIINNCDADKKRRTIIDALKLKKKIIINPSILGYVEYYNDNETWFNIKKIKNNNAVKIINLTSILKTIPCLSIIEDYNDIDTSLLFSFTNLTHLTFGVHFYEPVYNLPKNLTHLTFGNKFNQPVDYLPETLTHLTFGFYFNRKVDKLPENLTHLTFGTNFNQPVDNLPENLTHLTFGRVFNQSVDKLPETLIHLTFGTNFNQPVDKLPETLTHLTFGHEFNQPVDKLPINLTHLTFGWFLNQSVDNLPLSLTHLTFGANFNQPVDNLPINLTHLTFDDFFNQPVDNLPETLTHLTFGIDFNQKVDNLPETLTHLVFGRVFNQSVDKLPETLTHLVFGRVFNQSVDKLPINLTHLTFDYFFNQPVDKLPINLTHLVFGSVFNQSVDNLPLSLTHLTVYENFIAEKSLINLPVKLSHIKLIIINDIIKTPTYLDNLDKILPKTITHLILKHKNDNKYIEFPIRNLPETLIYLKIDGKYFNKLILPINLKELVIYYENSILNNLPHHIEKLFILFKINYYDTPLIDKLPSTLKEIVIEDIKFATFIKKPKGTILTIKKFSDYEEF
jgi:hypothetical protein